MLEDHVVNFIQKWHFPLGFFGQQGGESIQHEFVDLAATFSRVHPATERLKRMLNKHFVVVHPQNREIIPQTQRRNLKRKRDETLYTQTKKTVNVENVPELECVF